MRIALLLFFFPYLACGTGLDFLVDWLNGLGISYVPPMPRQGTCRDCSKSTLVSAGIEGKHFIFHEFRRDSVSTSHQHSQQDHVVQRKQQQPQRQQRLERHKHVHAAWKGQHALWGEKNLRWVEVMQIIPKLCENPGWEVPLDHGREFRVDRRLKSWRLYCHPVF